MNFKKGFQNLGTVLAAIIVIYVIIALAIGILHIALTIALAVAIIWLIYRGAIFVAEGFKDNSGEQ